MASLDMLPQLIGENPQAREEFLSMLVDFCQRHGIDAAPENFIGLSEGPESDTAGLVLPATTIGSPQTGIVTTQQPQVLIYRDGPRYSRWIWSG
jgi:hypothetical protein